MDAKNKEKEIDNSRTNKEGHVRNKKDNVQTTKTKMTMIMTKTITTVTTTKADKDKNDNNEENYHNNDRLRQQ